MKISTAIAFLSVSSSLQAATLSLTSTNDYVFVTGFPTNADFRGIGTGEDGLYSFPRLEDRAFLSEAMVERTFPVFAWDLIWTETNSNHYAINGYFFASDQIFSDYFKTNYAWSSTYVPDDFEFVSAMTFASESEGGWMLGSNDVTQTWKPFAKNDSRLYDTNAIRTRVDKLDPFYGREDGQYTLSFLEITNAYHNLKMMKRLIDENVELSNSGGNVSSSTEHYRGYRNDCRQTSVVVVESGNYRTSYYSSYTLTSVPISDDIEGKRRRFVKNDMWAYFSQTTTRHRPCLWKPDSADEDGHWTYSHVRDDEPYVYLDQTYNWTPDNKSSNVVVHVRTSGDVQKFSYPGTNEIDVAMLFLFELRDSVYKSNTYRWGYFDGHYVDAGTSTNITLPSQHVGVLISQKATRKDGDPEGEYGFEINEFSVYRLAIMSLTGLSDMSVSDPFDPVSSDTANASQSPGSWFFPQATNRREKHLYLSHFKAFMIIEPPFRATFTEE